MNKILIDTQNKPSDIKINLNRVGIKNLKLPIIVSQKSGGYQNTNADINCYVDLGPEIKGISMSRLPIGLNKFVDQPLSGKLIEDITEYIRIKSEASMCEVVYKFPFFLKRQSPIAKEPGLIHYDITFNGIKSESNYIFRFAVEVTATSLCPCSKELCQNNAHNQRSKIRLYITPQKDQWIWLEDIGKIAEQASSCEIYSILKRPDEQYVTQKMYEQPAFVEDITRRSYEQLIKLSLKSFRINVTNEESIHLHDAYASLWVDCK